jgi:hypothetical protein
MYAGFGLTARGRDPSADRFSIDELRTITGRLRADIKAMAAKAPAHDAWLTEALAIAPSPQHHHR